MQRNVRRNMEKNDAKEFNEELSIIRKSKDKQSAISKFENLCNLNKYKSFIKKLFLKKELYFTF